MRFRRLRDDVVMAERRVEVRVLRAQANWRVLGTVWREAWTPSRILVAGVAGGLLIAFSRPLGRLGNLGNLGGIPAARWIQLATSLSGLVTAVRARHAAESAETAAEDAGQAAEEAADTVDATAGAAAGPARDPNPSPEPTPAPERRPEPPGVSVSDARRRPEAPWSGEPRAAEAATEVSER